MKPRDIELATLSFKAGRRKAVQETFRPWSTTVEKWEKEELNKDLTDKLLNKRSKEKLSGRERYLYCEITDPTYHYEQKLGFDGVKRMIFYPPFYNFQSHIIEETEDYYIKRDEDGWKRKYYKDRKLVKEIEPVVETKEDWEKLKQKARDEIKNCYRDEDIEQVYKPYQKEHQKGEYSLRLRINGFFWTPKNLLGTDQYMFAFYDQPKLLHDINQFLLEFYLDRLPKLLDVLEVDLIFLTEDLSGKNGPLLSVEHFNEFMAPYYKKLVSHLKKKGVQNVFVDTDGDFSSLVPEFMKVGVDGFLPLDVNAGLDIVELRKKYPKLKLIGGFNKLRLADGKKAIEKEFKRLIPIIKQGGYILGIDHQVPPSVSLANYRYYIKRMQSIMGKK